jgi:Xaa-Pro dipeptidase
MSAVQEQGSTGALLHFHRDEYRARVERTLVALAERELDGILLFAPESHYYLCGYDTFGFALFQC